MNNYVYITIEGKKNEGSIKINLDYYSLDAVDKIYIPEIKKILIQVIEKEAQNE